MRLTFNSILTAVIIILGLVLFFQATEIDRIILGYLDREPKLTTNPPLQNKDISENLTFQQYLDRGDQLSKQGILELAVANYARAGALEPDSPLPTLRIAETYYEHGDFSRSVQNAKKILESHSGSVAAETMLLKSYLAAGNIEEAERAATHLKNPDIEGSYYRGILAAIGTNRDLAGQFLHRVIQLAEQNPTPENQEWQKRADRLIAAYREYDEYRDSPNPHLQALLIQALEENKQHRLALGAAEKLTAEYPEYRDAWIIRGHAELAEDNPEAAIKSWNTALALDETLAEPHYFLALAYLRLNDSDSALQSLNLAEALGWEDTLTLAEKRALAYTKQENWRQAAMEYEKILAETDSFSPSFLLQPLWIFFDKLQEPEKALEPTAILLENYAEDALAHSLRGWALFENKRFEEAKSEYDLAMSLDPNLPALHLYLGDWYLTVKKDKDRARDHYKKAFTLDPDGDIGRNAGDRYNGIR